MPGHVTQLRREPRTPDPREASSVLPPDLLEQVRGRVRLLAVLILAAFSFDIVVYLAESLVASLQGTPRTSGRADSAAFQWVNLAAVSASAVLLWVARKGGIRPSRLLTVGLFYEVVICAVIATVAIWQHYLEFRMVPNLTWVPAMVILFPLILPGPPRRVLAGAIASGAMVPLALWALERTGRVDALPTDYVRTSVHSAFAVVFAYLGARVIYRLGREVSAARELGSYRLEELLGRGGMGEVWRARHRMLARPAAVKVIRPSGGDGTVSASPDAIQRFEREAQAIARLRSPHTVELFDYGMADSGAFYYAMELLEGVDADTLVRRFGPLPADRTIHVLRQICHSLSEAEMCGLVHRDIKPANIFLCRYGEDCDFVKVLDFGLVKALGETTGTAPALTGENWIAGTPAFIAPEQALGRVDLDGRADLYAVGCVAYWLLTGTLVFRAETPMALLMQHAQEPPTAPSARSEQPVPAELDAIVLECLAKDPAGRPQTARELSRRLGAVEGAGSWTEDRARAWWANHLPASTSGHPRC